MRVILILSKKEAIVTEFDNLESIVHIKDTDIRYEAFRRWKEEIKKVD